MGLESLSDKDLKALKKTLTFEKYKWELYLTFGTLFVMLVTTHIWGPVTSYGNAFAAGVVFAVFFHLQFVSSMTKLIKKLIDFENWENDVKTKPWVNVFTKICFFSFMIIAFTIMILVFVRHFS
jgi:hypothetical protein